MLNVDIIDYYVVARGGIEPPTHGFSVQFSSTLYKWQGELICCRYKLIVVHDIQYYNGWMDYK